ncbi:uncharacterized protein [Temnothorax nylanderi]|uniref:uncharacterized protein isoform X2 n=1 Tax=Temnothorax nylanderi TaxID=102681 RepID=UPI003A8570C4
MAGLRAVDLRSNELSINVAEGTESVESDTIDTKARRRRAPETVDEHQAKRSKRTEDGEEVVQNGEDQTEIRQVGTIPRATREFKIQEGAVKKYYIPVSTTDPRINTTRSAKKIRTLLTELQDKISEIENQFDCLDELCQQEKFPRINTARSAIKTTLTELRDEIPEIENRFDCMDKLWRQLKKKYEVNTENLDENYLCVTNHQLPTTTGEKNL